MFFLFIFSEHLLSAVSGPLDIKGVGSSAKLAILFFTGRQHSFLCGVLLATVELSVGLSVRLSVTHWHCVKTMPAGITKSSPAVAQGFKSWRQKVHSEI